MSMYDEDAKYGARQTRRALYRLVFVLLLLFVFGSYVVSWM